jgi:hypothetical protein
MNEAARPLACPDRTLATIFMLPKTAPDNRPAPTPAWEAKTAREQGTSTHALGRDLVRRGTASTAAGTRETTGRAPEDGPRPTALCARRYAGKIRKSRHLSENHAI